MRVSKLPGARIEEVTFDLAGLATHTGPTIDTLDWDGAELVDFTDTRVFGWPYLDLMMRAPAAGNLFLQFATNSTPAAAPTLVWSAFSTVPVLAATWTGFSRQRLPVRFARYLFTDTSGAPQAGIYLFAALRQI